MWPGLRVKVPIRVGNLNHVSESPQKLYNKIRHRPEQILTASELIFPSGAPPLTGQSWVLGISITPSIIACATCTPLGPNSLARLCPVALRANFPLANEDIVADPLKDAVAPVIINEGGWGEVSTDSSRSGSVAWAKRKKPRLQYLLVLILILGLCSQAEKKWSIFVSFNEHLGHLLQKCSTHWTPFVSKSAEMSRSRDFHYFQDENRPGISPPESLGWRGHLPVALISSFVFLQAHL